MNANISNVRDALQTYLNVVGQGVGVTLVLNDDGVCGLQCAGDLTCGVVVLDEARVGFFAPMLTVGTLDRAKLFPELLSRNLFGVSPLGASLGFDEDEDRVILSLPIAVETLDATRFADRLAEFITAAGELKTLLDAVARGCGASKSGESFKAYELGFPLQGMRV